MNEASITELLHKYFPQYTIIDLSHHFVTADRMIQMIKLHREKNDTLVTLQKTSDLPPDWSDKIFKNNDLYFYFNDEVVCLDSNFSNHLGIVLYLRRYRNKKGHQCPHCRASIIYHQEPHFRNTEAHLTLPDHHAVVHIIFQSSFCRCCGCYVCSNCLKKYYYDDVQIKTICPECHQEGFSVMRGTSTQK